MANEFYDPGVDRAAKVNALFARVARRYDLINDLQSFGLHRWWKRRLVELARCGPDVRACDVCCGTGDIAFRLAAAAALVVGVDFTERMLEVARERARRKRERHGGAEFVRADAQRLPCPDNTFDVVTMGYGLRNLADWQAGLSEMCRVARPRGRIVVLEFGKPDNPVWRLLYYSYLRLFVPALGLIVCGSATAYAYILESLRNYPGQHGVAEAMVNAGLQKVRIVNFLGGVMTINYGEKPRNGEPAACHKGP